MNELQAAIEAIIYAAEEPATAAQIAAVLDVDKAQVVAAIDALQARYASDDFGVEVKAVAGGYRIGTKPQHHESVRRFIKNLKPPVRLSLAALETLAVVAYRQPITVPEIKEIRGVDPGGVVNTLLEKKLITSAGRKEVVGKPILYKTTRDFLIRFGLSSLNDLPTLKEFEEMARAGLEGEEMPALEAGTGAEPGQPSLLDTAGEPAVEDSNAESSSDQATEPPAPEAEAETASEPPSAAAEAEPGELTGEQPEPAIDHRNQAPVALEPEPDSEAEPEPPTTAAEAEPGLPATDAGANIAAAADAEPPAPAEPRPEGQAAENSAAPETPEPKAFGAAAGSSGN